VLLPIQAVFMLFVIFGMPVFVYAFVKLRVIGKMGCIFLEKDKSLNFKLHKVKGRTIELADETYGVNPSRIRIMRFPIGWPALFQQSIPVQLYQREDYHPLDMVDPVDWVHLKDGKDSAIMVKSSQEPALFKRLVEGTEEGGSKLSKTSKLIPMLTLGCAALVLLIMFYLISKIGVLEGEITQAQELIKLYK